MTMIVPKSHFVQIPWKVFFGDSVELCKTFLSIAPEAFQTVNINFACGKSFPMVDSQMPVTAEHQGVIAAEFVSVNDGATSDHFHSLSQQAFGSDVFYYCHLYFSVSLQDTKDGNLSGSTPATFTFTPAAEVGFIELNLSGEPEIAFSDHQGPSDEITYPQDSGIAQTDLSCYPACRDFEFKEFNDPQQLFQRNAALTNPPIREVMKGISASFAPELFTFQTIDFMAVTIGAENMAIFPTELSEEQFCPVFSFPYEFKGF